jgi:hypothetical protein
MSPIVATRLDFTLGSGGVARPTQWQVHSGSCTGAALASGQIKSGVASGPSGIIYQPLGAHPWWITLSLIGGQTLCGEVTTHT